MIGHELGHVAHRDHLRAMIYNGGTSFLIGLLFGDVTGAGAAIFAATTIFNASYSRDAETSADGFAIACHAQAGTLAERTWRIADASSGKSGDGPKLLSSHPLTAERLARMTKEDRARDRAGTADARRMVGAEGDLRLAQLTLVMPALVAGIHVFLERLN